MKKWLSATALLLISTHSNALPIGFTFSGAWTDTFGAPFAATYDATVIFDNGGNTIANQNYGEADFVSATVVSGAYDFTMNPGDITWQRDFITDALGQLSDGWFDAANGGHFWHFDPWWPDVYVSAPNGTFAQFFSSNISAPGTPVPVPLPLALIGLGLAGMALVRRKTTA